CREGELKAWAKHDAKLVRGEHMMPMVAQAAVPSASARLGLCEITPSEEDQEALDYVNRNQLDRLAAGSTRK
ncbi:MAG: hypothetical protein ACT4O2_02530, partial [Beijerinckiaceae bacterium]